MGGSDEIFIYSPIGWGALSVVIIVHWESCRVVLLAFC